MYKTFIGQKGSALVISLIFLLLMMIVGVGAMQSSILQERMAGNVRDINSAFQAAEAALRQGEAYLADASTLPQYPDGTDGLFELCSSVKNSVSGGSEEADQNAGEGAAETPEDGEGEGSSNDSSICAPNWNSKSESEEEKWVEYSGFGGGVSRNPEYIIEKYMEPLEGDTLNANQILEDSNLYRITARGYGVSDHSVVILQSVYRKD